MVSRLALRRTFAVASVPLLVILYLNIERLVERYGWDALLSTAWEAHMPTLYGWLTQPWLAVVATAGVAFTLGLWLDAFLRFKERDIRLSQFSSRIKTTADNAEALSKKMHESFDQYAAEAWQILEEAKHFIHLDRGEVWRVSHVYSDHDVAEMARLMASISGRLRLVLSGDLPVPGDVITNQAESPLRITRPNTATGKPP